MLGSSPQKIMRLELHIQCLLNTQFLDSYGSYSLMRRLRFPYSDGMFPWILLNFEFLEINKSSSEKYFIHKQDDNTWLDWYTVKMGGLEFVFQKFLKLYIPEGNTYRLISADSMLADCLSALLHRCLLYLESWTCH